MAAVDRFEFSHSATLREILNYFGVRYASFEQIGEELRQVLPRRPKRQYVTQIRTYIRGTSIKTSGMYASPDSGYNVSIRVRLYEPEEIPLIEAYLSSRGLI